MELWGAEPLMVFQIHTRRRRLLANRPHTMEEELGLVSSAEWHRASRR